jgi:hypothetical protein
VVGFVLVMFSVFQEVLDFNGKCFLLIDKVVNSRIN